MLTGCSDSLVNFFAFHPLPGSQVDFRSVDPSIKEIHLESADGVRLHAFYLPRPGTDRVVLFLHGNAGNASYRLWDAKRMASLGSNVFLLSYRGYGKSGGSPSEQGVYLDALAALDYVESSLGFPKDRTIVFGRSIGAAVAVENAQNQPFAGIILVTPFSSGKDMASHVSFSRLAWLAWLAGNPFNSIDKIRHVIAPILFIHGDADDIVPIELSRKLFEVCPSPKTFRVAPGAGHNDLVEMAGDSYWEWIKQFINSVAPIGSDLQASSQSDLDASFP